ncbi:hypothetical protein N9Q58_03510 [Polaribacter sp.]|nr:hypothetical protein [Polaribacter sp.]
MNIENIAKLIEFERQDFHIEIELDCEDVFTDFIMPININSENDAILYFENECIKRFTCNHQFTVEEIKENGEEILFF